MNNRPAGREKGFRKSNNVELVFINLPKRKSGNREGCPTEQKSVGERLIMPEI